MNNFLFGLGIAMMGAGTFGVLVFNADPFPEGSGWFEAFSGVNTLATWIFFIGIPIAIIGVLEK